MRAYHRLTEGQRNQVYALKKAGLKQYAIADQIGVSKSTISREFKRNTGLRGYRPKQAHRLACSRQARIRRTRISDVIWTRIEEMICEELSPEQITGHLKDIGEPSVSPEWIYQQIYADKRNGGDLHTHLRCQKQRRKRYGSTERRGQIKNRVSIEKRPAVVDLRSRIGDWEADTVIGKQGHSVLVTLVERKTRFTVAIKAVNKTARAVTDAICDYLKPYQERGLTLTYDNVLYAELLADLASDHYRIEVSRHVHSMAPFGFLVTDSLSHNQGYRMIAGMLNNSGWHVNHKRVERIWRREGLKVPHKQKKKVACG